MYLDPKASEAIHFHAVLPLFWLAFVDSKVEWGK